MYIKVSGRFSLFLASLCLVFLVLWGCAKYAATIAVTEVSLGTTTVSVNLGATKTLTATLFPSNATDKKISWSTSDATIATVDAKGVVTGIKVGTATVVVTTNDGNKVAKATVTVNALAVVPVESVKLISSNSNGVVVDKTITLAAMILPAEADQNVTWTSSDPTIAKVDANGMVTGLRAGTVEVTVASASQPTKSDKKTITVSKDEVRVKSVSVSPETASLVLGGDSQLLKATLQPANPAPTNSGVVWSTSDDKIAIVDQNGNVTALDVGNAMITATTVDGGFEDTCAVTVIKPRVQSINITTPSSDKLNVGSTLTLTATALPAAADQSVTWISSDTTIATVDAATGVVRGVAAGDAIITAKSVSNTTITAKTTIKVVVPVSTLSVSPTQATVKVRTTAVLIATITPDNATNSNLSWSSSDNDIATVGVTGVVTGVKVGTATITATTTDGSNKTATCDITVSPEMVAVKGVSINSTATIAVHTTQQLNATISPDNATNKNVTWTSNDHSVATIDASGSVTMVGNGTAIITVTTEDGGKTATCEVTTFAAAGLENRTILDSAISASTFYPGYSAPNGRLNSVAWAYWAPETSNMPQWWQVDLGRVRLVGKVAVQSSKEISNFIKTYRLQYSDDGITWKDYNKAEVIQGPNRQTDDISYKLLTPPFKARYVRFTILSAQGLSVGKFEVYVSD